MTAPQLLELLEQRGARLFRRGDRLAIDAPRGALLDLAPELAKFKPALLELLDAQRDGATATGREDEPTFPRDFDTKAAHWRLPAKLNGLNRAAQIERARQGIEPRFLARLEHGDATEGRTGETREVWAVAVCVALLDAGKSPE